MTPSVDTITRDAVAQTAIVATLPKLDFKPITLADMPLINSMLQASLSRTCDYSVGGIYMWIEYFKYEYCVVCDTLFIKGRTENNRSETAFCVPVGSLDLREAVAMVRLYCAKNDIRPVFSAVPDDRLDALVDAVPAVVDVEPLDDWADYLYDIRSLATLTGKAMMKKRNHVNRFEAENPNRVFEPITPDILPELMLYMAGHDSRAEEKANPEMTLYEAQKCMDVLENYSSYPFEGAVLRGEAGDIVAFSIGEVIGDTLYTHIEKMNHDCNGAGEAINKYFAAYMLERHPGLRYSNREDDGGDPGLRHAKESYKPAALLRKYNVRIG